jgi:hypothetical protein
MDTNTDQLEEAQNKIRESLNGSFYELERLEKTILVEKQELHKILKKTDNHLRYESNEEKLNKDEKWLEPHVLVADTFSVIKELELEIKEHQEKNRLLYNVLVQINLIEAPEKMLAMHDNKKESLKDHTILY